MCEISGTIRANVSGLADFPQWLDYHNMHGVEHFIIYTTNDMSPTLREVYQPYDEGLVTRVHLDMPADKCHCQRCWQQEMILTDCLYRAKGHAKRLFPSLDVDEYVIVRSGEDISSFLDKTQSDGKISKKITFQRHRYARTQAGLEISSPFCEPTLQTWSPKYAANVCAASTVRVHDAIGIQVHISPKVAKVNHYRHPSVRIMKANRRADSTDFSLVAEVPTMQQVLKKRFGEEWQKFLENAKLAPELNAWTCPDDKENAPLEKGQIF